MADIGSGTWYVGEQIGSTLREPNHWDSIWPIDLLNDLSFPIQIDAVDISLAQCPPKPWLPDGMTTIAHDAYTAFPEHMIGKYDLVHV